MGFTIAHEWLHQDQLGRFLLGLHTLEILHLEKIYPLLNGLGLVGLLITGVSMIGLFRIHSLRIICYIKSRQN